jgi:hypothetical protein
VIDPGLPELWPEPVREACSQFKQGDLVASPPFFYGACAAYALWDLTSDAGDQDVDLEILALEEGLGPDYGLITTQTCDLDEQGKPRKPWLQVAPVYDATDVIPADSVGNLRKDAIGHLMLLDPPDLPDRLWIVDFRVEFPMEKSWLVGKTPHDAFASEERYLRLAERLAGRVGRPALSNALVAVLREVSAWWEGDAGVQAKACVDVRLVIVDGTRLMPRDCYFLVLTDAAPMSEEGRDSWQSCWQRASSVATQHGINLTTNVHETLDSLSARGLRDSVPLWPL